MAHRTPRKRRYPPFYEKVVPVALVIIALTIVALLLVIFGVVVGLIPGVR